jgi:hypothetical protein
MNVEIGTEAAQFPEKEYIVEIFLAVWVHPEFFSFKSLEVLDFKMELNKVYLDGQSVCCLNFKIMKILSTGYKIMKGFEIDAG